MIKADLCLPHVESLLKKAKLSADVLSFENYVNGGNNRTYRLKTADGIFAVKQYFRGPTDKRDRLAAEFSFLNYAQFAAPHFVPKAYAVDEEHGFALYEFIEGHAIKADELTEWEVSQAIEFFCLLNEVNAKHKAASLPLASEAGFSIQNHIDMIDARINELRVAMLAEANNDAEKVINTLHDAWRALIEQTTKNAHHLDIDMAANLSIMQRCVSPSDFGFHNALRVAKDHLCFLDFEYAGWDDPARMANDFFSQLAVPVPSQYYETFVQQVMRPFPDAEHLRLRAQLLRPIYKIKWCCIALNVFIPAHMARRQFANPNLNIVDLHKAQLAKANLILSNLESTHHVLY